jgi:hypothetical protein
LRIDLTLIRRSFARVYRRFAQRDAVVPLVGGMVAIGRGCVSSIRFLLTTVGSPVPSIRGPLPQIQESLAGVGVQIPQVGCARPRR